MLDAHFFTFFSDATSYLYQRSYPIVRPSFFPPLFFSWFFFSSFVPVFHFPPSIFSFCMVLILLFFFLFCNGFKASAIRSRISSSKACTRYILVKSQGWASLPWQMYYRTTFIVALSMTLSSRNSYCGFRNTLMKWQECKSRPYCLFWIFLQSL